MKLTITECLQELKTVQKKINKKQEFVQNYLFRQEAMKDPFENDGGTHELLRKELQAISDLRQRYINIRAAITTANLNTTLTLHGVTRTVQDWLTWRREIAMSEERMYQAIQRKITDLRNTAQMKGFAVHDGTDKDKKPEDIIIHVDEYQLTRDVERIAVLQSDLDGKLSLLNATTVVEID